LQFNTKLNFFRARASIRAVTGVLLQTGLFILPLYASGPIGISSLFLETKQNGIFIRIRSTAPVPPAEITGWRNENTGWFYITIHGADADTAKIESAQRPYPVTKIECIRAGESLQIGFKLQTSVEQFEFYHFNDPPEILALLRFPLSEALTSIESISTPYENPRYKALIRGLYFSGASLTTVGLFAGAKRKGWEIPMGLGLVATAYVIDTFIHGRKK